MMQQKSDENFGIPEFRFKVVRPYQRKKWKIIGLLSLLLVSGSIISCCYYIFYESSTNYYRVLFDDNKARKQSLVLPNNHNGDDEEFEEDFYNEPKSYDLGATKKELEIISKRPIQLIKRGTYQQISSPQGIFHIVIGMFCDKTKAMHCVYRLMKENRSVILLIPPKGEHYYRVTIEHTATHQEAEKKLKLLKSLYGENISILYY